MQDQKNSELVNKYKLFLRDFALDDVSKLTEVSISPNIIKEYNEKLIRFRAWEIIEMDKAGISPNLSEKYSWRFDGGEISRLHLMGVSSEVANKYGEQFSDWGEIIQLVIKGCSPDIANQYKGFKAFDIIHFIDYDISSEIACSYNLYNKFSGLEIVNLVDVCCPPEKVPAYDKSLGGISIAVLYSIGLDPSKLNSFTCEKKKRLYEVLDSIIKTSPLSQEICKFKLTRDKSKDIYPKISSKKIIRRGKDYSFIGTGYHSLVLLNKGNAFKFSLNIQEEEELLRRLDNPQNIINFKQGIENNRDNEKIAIELEYIQGDSLESILEKENKLDSEKVLNYGSDIMNGLIEMRQAGIFYHRDLRPANIMIEETEDKAVIIDLGIATTDRNALPKDNRRYGGVNDLVSLGQVMYKMATGEHIFSESKSMEQTIHCHKIKDSRDLIYSDNTGQLIQEKLELVDKNVEDESIKTLIKSCLTAKNHEYKKMHKMFQSYLKA